MKKVVYNKLVRDGIPAHLDEYKLTYDIRPITDDAIFEQEVRKKIVEEALEVQAAGNREELIKEMADVAEVLRVLQGIHGVTPEEVEVARVAKRDKKGGFDQRLFVAWCEDHGYEERKKQQDAPTGLDKKLGQG